MSIGERIRKERKMQKMSLKALADMVGCSVQAISQYERGIRTITFGMLSKIADALQIDFVNLIDFDEVLQGVNEMRWVDDDDKEFLMLAKAINDRIEYTEDSARIKDDPETEQTNKANAERFFNDTHAIAIQNRLANAFNSMNTKGQEKAVDAVETLAKVPEYKKIATVKNPKGY